jgi:hypothetical protein
VNVTFVPYGFGASGKGEDIKLRRGVPVVTFEEELVYGSLLIDNIFGNPSLVLGVTYPAEIMESGLPWIFGVLESHASVY